MTSAYTEDPSSKATILSSDTHFTCTDMIDMKLISRDAYILR